MANETNETENPLEEIRKTQKRICSQAIRYAIGVALALLLFGERAIAKGLLLGTLFSIINFVLMGQSIPMVLGRTRTKARAIGFFSILGRYVILAVPLILGIKMDTINFWAAVVGIFAVQLVTLMDYIILSRLGPKA